MRLSLQALAPTALALAVFGGAVGAEARRSYRHRFGSCSDGFKYELDGKSICVANGWSCGSGGVTCDSKPAEVFCPTGYAWYEKDDVEGCVPTSGDDEDCEDDGKVDCGEGFEWIDHHCAPYTPPPDENCDPAHNWWWGGGEKCGVPNRCVPTTEPSTTPTPPGDDCCPEGWKYKGLACVPPKPDWPDCFGKPACPPTHKWSPSKGRCTKKRRGGGGHHHHHRRLLADNEMIALGERDDELCPFGLTSCPVASAVGSIIDGAWECLDPLVELESCGGCTSFGQGQDCTSIPGANSVGCEAGHCKVYSCAQGELVDNACVSQ